MAAAVSVSAAAGEQDSNAGPKFSARPLYARYDPAVEQDDWVSNKVREPEGVRGQEVVSLEDESRRRVDEELTALSAEEIERRLERTRREFYNRRKIIIKNLPADINNQEVHELLKDYDLKYCFVDKYKGTAFVTLLNGEQAQSAIRAFHRHVLREREISVQLQPADALLCVANLPRSLSQQQFEELVRPFGNLERCFLVYSHASGHSKGYGFAEFMKKDSAARAKSELLGKRLGSRVLYVHWTEAGSLSYPLLHSSCLCVDHLPQGPLQAQDVQRALADTHAPTFCQLAQGQDGSFRRFAVLEFASPELAEEVQRVADGRALGGAHIRVSFCAPGPPGRSMLAALIAAQTMALNRGKGLLPEPTALQILSGLNNPAALKMLLAPLAQGRKHGLLGPPPAVPLLTSPALSAALLQMLLQSQAQVQQHALLWAQLLPSREVQRLPGTGMLGDFPQQLQQGVHLLGDHIPGGGVMPPLGLPPDAPGPIKPPAAGRPLQRDRDSPPATCGLNPTPSPALQGIATPLLGPLLGADRSAGPGVSLLGEPPIEVSLSQNPFLNMQGILPPSGASCRPHPYRKKAGPGSQSHQRSGHMSLSGYSVRYQDSYPPSEYPGHHQEAVSYPYGLEDAGVGALAGPGYCDQLPYSYHSSPPPANCLSSAQLNKAVGMLPLTQPNSLYSPAPGSVKTPIGSHKRLFSRLIPSPEPSPEGGYVGQHSQGLGGHYADSYLKRKRIF